MAASPFTFLRGAAAVMAWDLAKTPNMGHTVVIDGDAHLNNFGFFGTPQQDLVIDLNDFDDGTCGPWGWDLKRLVASVNVAARENGMNRRERRASVMRCVVGYRMNAKRLQAIPVLDVWHLHAHVDRTSPLVKIDPKSRPILAKAKRPRLAKHTALLKKERRAPPYGEWQFRTDPSILTPITLRRENHQGQTAIRRHCCDRKALLRKYHVVDVACRVAGVEASGRALSRFVDGAGRRRSIVSQVKEATVRRTRRTCRLSENSVMRTSAS
jgi:hypothetical protein